MSIRTFGKALCILVLSTTFASAQEPKIPPGHEHGVLRLEAGGPTSFVTAMAFSQDGQTLYAAGFDKVVRVWRIDPKTKEFVLDQETYRVPIGPGLAGAINAVALSSDPAESYLAVGGISPFRGMSWFSQPGIIFFRDSRDAVMTAEMRKDQGLIYVFHTKEPGKVTILRGHEGPIMAMSFAPMEEGKPPLLVSIGQERDPAEKKYLWVARLWDVRKGAELKKHSGAFLPKYDFRPGLATWYAGQKRELQVAIAVDDGNSGEQGYLRVWDVDHDAEGIWKRPDGMYNNTAVYVPGKNRLLTGSTVRSGGRLQSWYISPDQKPQEDTEIGFPPAGSEYYYPRAVTLVSSRANGRLDHAVVAVRVHLRDKPSREDEWRLRLIDLGGNSFRVLKREIFLWKGGDSLPVLAAAPRGRYLAAAGNQDHKIRVFSIDALLQGRGKPRDVQTLRSVGTKFTAAAFVVKEDKDKGAQVLGLWLSEKARKVRGQPPRQAAKDGLILDLAKRTLIPAGADGGWRLTVPPKTADWEAERSVLERDAERNMPTRYRLLVRENRVDKKRIEVEARDVTDYAILPPQPPWQVPLLAVAVRDLLDQPVLHLYNAASGELVREFTGHTDPIRSLAFSPDGRLLVSAAEDQTVSVWSLTSLEQILGKRGMLQGVGLEEGRLVVAHIDRDSSAGKPGKLQKGDGIEGLITKGELQRFETPRDFYEAVTLIGPGEEALLKVGERENPVAIKLGQLVDERKPLLTLFVTEPDPGDPKGQREWVGWHPNAYYEASDRKAERLIGLHFNTGNEKHPTSFALADEFRKEHYREGLLKHLVARGNIADALDDWDREDKQKRLPAPKMWGWIDELGPEPKNVDANGDIVLQRRTASFRLRIDDLPPDKVDSVKLQLAGQAKGDFKQVSEHEWLADLTPLLPFKRGDRYSVQAIVRTVAEVPQEFSFELRLRYVPPAPVVMDVKALGLGLANWLPSHQPALTRALATMAPEVATKPEFTLQGLALAGAPDEPFEISLRLNGKDIPVKLGPSRAISEELKDLRLGDNLIEVTAVNQKAPAGDRQLETSRLTQVVSYRPPDEKKIPPPRIILASVAAVAGAEEAQKIEPGQTVIVSSRKVRITGKIQADENLVRAEWAKGTARKRLDGFAAVKDLFIKQDLPALEPGEHTFRFLAQTASSAEAETAVTIDYRPPLPRVEIQALQPAKAAGGRARLATEFYDEGQGPPQVKLQCRLMSPDDPQKFEAEVLVNGEKVPSQIDVNKETLTAEFVLKSKENQVQVKLTNKWNEAIGAEMKVSYKRVPRDIKWLAPPEKSPKALVKLVAEVYSELKLTREFVAAKVNGRPIAPDHVKVAAAARDHVWQVELEDIALKAGKNQVSLAVTNDDGPGREPAVATIEYTPPGQAPAAPVVEITDPAVDIKVTRPDLLVRARFKSEVAVKEVKLLREGGRVPFQTTFDVPKLQKGANGFYVLPPTKVPLVPGNNTIRVEAVSEGGPGQAAVNVNYLYMPVRVAGLQLKPVGKDPIRPDLLPNGKLDFREPVATARVTLTGKVLWDQASSQQLQEAGLVRFYVNGSQQVPRPLKERVGKNLEREFETEIWFNRLGPNRVEIELPGLKQEAGNRHEFEVTCTNPVLAERLHYLVIGYQDKSPEDLRIEALRAIRAKPDGNGNYKSDGVFNEIQCYVLTGSDVNPRKIETMLAVIKTRVDALARSGSASDVVLVYYHGKEKITNDHDWLLTKASEYYPSPEQGAVTCQGLESYFRETLGAKILVLDVGQIPADKPLARGERKDAVTTWSNSYTAVYRCSTRADAREAANRWLLSAMDEGMPRGKRLGLVTSAIDDRFKELQSKNESLAYVRLLPDTYAGLLFSPGR